MSEVSVCLTKIAPMGEFTPRYSPAAAAAVAGAARATGSATAAGAATVGAAKRLKLMIARIIVLWVTMLAAVF